MSIFATAFRNEAAEELLALLDIEPLTSNIVDRMLTVIHDLRKAGDLPCSIHYTRAAAEKVLARVERERLPPGKATVFLARCHKMLAEFEDEMQMPGALSLAQQAEVEFQALPETWMKYVVVEYVRLLLFLWRIFSRRGNYFAASAKSWEACDLSRRHMAENPEAFAPMLLLGLRVSLRRYSYLGREEYEAACREIATTAQFLQPIESRKLHADVISALETTLWSLELRPAPEVKRETERALAQIRKLKPSKP